MIAYTLIACRVFRFVHTQGGIKRKVMNKSKLVLRKGTKGLTGRKNGEHTEGRNQKARSSSFYGRAI